MSDPPPSYSCAFAGWGILTGLEANALDWVLEGSADLKLSWSLGLLIGGMSSATSLRSVI